MRAVILMIALTVLFFSMFLFTPFIIEMVRKKKAFFLSPVINWKKKKSEELFEEQFTNAVETLSGTLRAGLSFLQGLNVLQTEYAPPLKDEIDRVLSEINLGKQVDVALEEMAERLKNEDVMIVVSATNSTRRIGGNLSDVFEKIARTIKERKRIKEKIRVFTSQGRFQGIIMALLPVVIFILYFFLDPDMVKDFFYDPIGWALLFLGVTLDLFGWFFIKKIIDIEV